MEEVVWLLEYRRHAYLINMGAFYSTVRFTTHGIDYEVLVENDDFELWEERATEYQSD